MMKQPYIHIRHRQPNKYEGYFVGYVPFIPDMKWIYRTTMLRESLNQIAQRQLRFINDLTTCYRIVEGASVSLELRLISTPRPDHKYNEIQIFFVGKVTSSNESNVRDGTKKFWERFHSYYPTEEPYRYPIYSITTEDVSDTSPVAHRDKYRLMFKSALSPFQDDTSIVEIRRFEESNPFIEVSLDDQERSNHSDTSQSILDQSGYSRFLEVLSEQQFCVVSICLSPRRIERGEVVQAQELLRRLKVKTEDNQNPKTQVLHQKRYNSASVMMKKLFSAQNRLFELKIQVLSTDAPSLSVAAALSAELNHRCQDEIQTWRIIEPDKFEKKIALDNFNHMDFHPWGKNNEEYMARFSKLSTNVEALAVFRLPVPPANCNIPGIAVRSEPFILSDEYGRYTSNRSDEIVLKLGRITHFGTTTDTWFELSLNQIKRHVLIAGSTGSGKTNSCLHILTSLWKTDEQIPFLVINPIDKPDYRVLMHDSKVRKDLLLFTLADPTVSPLRFNPLSVPHGKLLSHHINELITIFKSAFSLWDPLPAIYEESLRRLYKNAGYGDLDKARGGDNNVIRDPIMNDFYEVLVLTTSDLTAGYGQEVKGNIRSGAEIRIRSLITTYGDIFNVYEPLPWEILLKYPTVIELGRVGADAQALLIGFIMNSFKSTRAIQTDRRDARLHVTLIEEAHRLMSNNTRNSSFSGNAHVQASEDFSNLLNEVRGYNEVMLIAEQTPTNLVNSVIANTFTKVMHSLQEPDSHRLFSDIMNLDEDQKDYVHTLKAGYAVIRNQNGKPLLLQIPNYIDEVSEGKPFITESDITEHMSQQRIKIGYTLKEAESSNKSVVKDKGTLGCSFCGLLFNKVPCNSIPYTDGMREPKHRSDTRNHLHHYPKRLHKIFEELNEVDLDNLLVQISLRIPRDNGRRRDIALCYIAREATDYLNAMSDSDRSRYTSQIKKILETVLRK